MSESEKATVDMIYALAFLECQLHSADVNKT